MSTSNLPVARDSEVASYPSRRIASKAACIHYHGNSCLQSALELFLMNAHAPSVLHPAAPSRSIFFAIQGGVIQSKRMVSHERDLLIETQGQFRPLLVGVCGESAAFPAK